MTRKQLNKFNAIKPLYGNQWGFYTREEKLMKKIYRLAFGLLVAMASFKFLYTINW